MYKKYIVYFALTWTALMAIIFTIWLPINAKLRYEIATNYTMQQINVTGVVAMQTYPSCNSLTIPANCMVTPGEFIINGEIYKYELCTQKMYSCWIFGTFQSCYIKSDIYQISDAACTWQGYRCYASRPAKPIVTYFAESCSIIYINSYGKYKINPTENDKVIISDNVATIFTAMLFFEVALCAALVLILNFKPIPPTAN